MPTRVHLAVSNKQTLLCAGEFAEPIELGRQSAADEGLFQPQRDRDGWRIPIARPEEQELSRRYARLELLPDGRLQLTNLSAHLPIPLTDAGELPPGVACTPTLPLRFSLGDKTIDVQAVVEPEPLQSLPTRTRLPGELGVSTTLLSSLAKPAARESEAETFVRWLQTALDVLQSAATSSDFFAKAVRAAVELAGLDSSRMLTWDGQDWQTGAIHTVSRLSAIPDWQPSRGVLDRVRQEKRTFWQEPQEGFAEGASLRRVKAVVAAPILDRSGEVIAVLYGDCRQDEQAGPRRLGRLEATLVELLAGVVAAGLARLEQERAALAVRVRLEQSFPAELVPILLEHPERLEQGRDAEVTVLFADIRGFSRISERLGPARTVEWVRDVMEALSDCVLAHRGVLVNYIGDELMAMWGAPEERRDHAELACRAALAMLDLLAPLNERWQSVLREPMALGIGLNTGVARVGNTGSQRRVVYGPLGNTVNLASRVRGATKHLRSNLLITGTTRAQLGKDFAVRRLAQVRAVNIAETVELYELVGAGLPGWDALKDAYEDALTKYSAGAFREAIHILGRLLPRHPNDGPLLVLLSRAVSGLGEEPATFDPVWHLPGK